MRPRKTDKPVSIPKRSRPRTREVLLRDLRAVVRHFEKVGLPGFADTVGYAIEELGTEVPR